MAEQKVFEVIYGHAIGDTASQGGSDGHSTQAGVV